METITLTTVLSLDEYFKVNLRFFYSKWFGKCLIGLGLFFLFVGLMQSVSGFQEDFPWQIICIGLYLTIGFPISLYFSSRKSYRSNPRVSEQLTYTFDRDNIKITGESFSSIMSWDKIYQVSENKYAVLILTNPQVANIIPKRDFPEQALALFREIVHLHEGKVKNKLKNA